ncbi:hypothetical protein [Phenylobacterium sp.]|uniref:hypothetical protein n=1 Tax=Phenylobacterium sp. TaxID=1871053 RepID=UPI0028125439|nr:hypothetical protein [Phenylobacterium sp.]
MRDIVEIIEQYGRFSTILVAQNTPAITADLVKILVEAGINVIGPVDRAAHALAMAAQTPVDLALVTPKLAGCRDGEELARVLADTWGVRSVIVSAS